MAERQPVANVLLIAAGCAITLAAIHWLTAPAIRSNEAGAARALLTTLVANDAALPTDLPELSAGPSSWLLCDGTLLGRSDAPGYSGPIRLLYTLEAHERTPPSLFRLRLLSHQETPGITDFLQAEQGWLQTLQGRTAASITGVSAVSGATITTRALIDHLTDTLEDPLTALGEPKLADCSL